MTPRWYELSAAFKTVLNVFKTFLQNTTFQCYHYLVDPNLHWLERIFWLVCIALAASYGIIMMIRSTVAYNLKPITLAVDTNYLHWVNDLPAVIICENDLDGRRESIFNHLPDEAGIPPDEQDEIFKNSYHERISGYANELAFFANMFSKMEVCLYKNQEDNSRLEEKAVKACEYFENNVTQWQYLRRTCRDMFWKCVLNGVELECCDEFLPMKTIFGTCFAWNSIIATNSTAPRFAANADVQSHLKVYMRLESNRFNNFVLSREDTLSPRDSDRRKMIDGRITESFKSATVYVRTKTMVNDEGVRDVPMDIRDCRFPDESNLIMSHYYGFSACMIEQMAQLQLKKCKCTQFFLPEFTDKSRFCATLKDLACLSEDTAQLLNAMDADKCMVSCVESEVHIVGASTSRTPSTWDEVPVNPEEGYKCTISVIFYPVRIRFHRRIMRDAVDLIVNIGGIGTLFFGASIISMVEIIYYFFINPCIHRPTVFTFDRSRLDLPAEQKRQVLGYIDFKERMLNMTNRKKIIPFRK